MADPAGAGWYNDLPSGPVDQDELDKVLLNWGNTAAPTAVPEPSTVILLGVGLVGVALGRRVP